MRTPQLFVFAFSALATSLRQRLVSAFSVSAFQRFSIRFSVSYPSVFFPAAGVPDPLPRGVSAVLLAQVAGEPGGRRGESESGE